MRDAKLGAGDGEVCMRGVSVYVTCTCGRECLYRDGPSHYTVAYILYVWVGVNIFRNVGLITKIGDIPNNWLDCSDIVI